MNCAITALACSLTTNFWISDTRVVARYGDEVFCKEAETALCLRLLQEERKVKIPATTLQLWIDRITKADRLLATDEIQAAIDAGAPQEQLIKASKQIVEGDKTRNQGQQAAAILHYWEAWKHARPFVERRH